LICELLGRAILREWLIPAISFWAIIRAILELFHKRIPSKIFELYFINQKGDIALIFSSSSLEPSPTDQFISEFLYMNQMTPLWCSLSNSESSLNFCVVAKSGKITSGKRKDLTMINIEIIVKSHLRCGNGHPVSWTR